MRLQLMAAIKSKQLQQENIQKLDSLKEEILSKLLAQEKFSEVIQMILTASEEGMDFLVRYSSSF